MISHTSQWSAYQTDDTQCWLWFVGADYGNEVYNINSGLPQCISMWKQIRMAWFHLYCAAVSSHTHNLHKTFTSYVCFKSITAHIQPKYSKIQAKTVPVLSHHHHHHNPTTTLSNLVLVFVVISRISVRSGWPFPNHPHTHTHIHIHTHTHTNKVCSTLDDANVDNQSLNDISTAQQRHQQQ